jgi:hypothetical protein
MHAHSHTYIHTGIEVSVIERKYSPQDTGKVIQVALVDLLPISELDEGTELVGDVLDLQVCMYVRIYIYIYIYMVDLLPIFRRSMKAQN